VGAEGDEDLQIRLVHRLGDESWFITVGALTEAGCERIGGVLASELSFYTATELVEEAQARPRRTTWDGSR
jgi:hypothetical protein